MKRSGTVQGDIDIGHSVRAHCGNCRHHAMLDHLVLREKLGPDHSTMHDDLVPLLVCSKCGSKNISLTVVPGTQEYGGNPYLKAKGGR